MTLKKPEKDAVIRSVPICIFSIISLIAVNYYYFSTSQLYNSSIINLVLLSGIFLLIHRAYAISDRYLHRLSLFSSILLSLALTEGKAVYISCDAKYVFSDMAIFQEYFIILTGFIILFYFVIKLCLFSLRDVEISSPLKNQFKYFGSSPRSLFVMWALIFICWIPCYLAYYPGIFSYDIMGQTYQALGIWDYNRFQAIGHTFFVALCFKFGGLFGGPTAQLVAYSLIQMLIISFAFSFAVWYLAKLNVPYGFRIFALLYFALNPINAIFSFVPAKDVLFTAFFIFLTVLLISLIRNPDEFLHSIPKQLAFVLNTVALCLFRNNSIYVFILFFPILMIIYRKNCWLRILRLGVISVLSFVIIYSPILNALGVKPGNIKEALAVPIQQIACVEKYHRDTLTEEQTADITELFSDTEHIGNQYNVRFADPVKDKFNTELFSSDKARFIKLWFSLLTEYPADYFSAFFNLNIAYWYPDTEQPDPYSNRQYIETYICHMNAFQLERDSKSEVLLSFYELFADNSEIQTIPLLSLFYSIGTPTWFMLFAVILLLYKKRKKLCIVFLPGIIMMLTFLIGPTANFRYVYPVIALYPFYIALLLCSKRFSEDNKAETEPEKVLTKVPEKDSVAENEVKF